MSNVFCAHSIDLHNVLTVSPRPRCSSQVVEDLPRVIRSVDMIHQEVSSLKDRITVVKEDVERVSCVACTFVFVF